MTIVKENFMTTGLSGKYDNKVVFRQWKGRTIFAKPPRKQEKATPNQLTQKELFLDAVDYATVAMTDPDLKEAYRKMAPYGASAYNMAVADFLSLPKVHRIDTGGYCGLTGGLINIAAEDKCGVKSVSVKIALADGTLVEEGTAVKVGEARMWIYTATTDNPQIAGSVINATATDVPGHSVEGEVTL
jgi:hypothetical protein